MKYTLQIFSGNWNKADYQAEDIIRKIDDIAGRIPVAQVIIGWNINTQLYKETAGFLHDAGIKMLLWLPVFSAVDGIAEPDEALDIFGQKILTPDRQVEEGFVFGCPSSKHNIQIVKNIYETHFSGCGFDGVFLDRVRSQSFVAGIPGVLSCGCTSCRKAFLKRGVDIDEVGKRYQEKNDAFFDMVSYPANGAFELKDELAQRFFEVKEEIIADAVADICLYFKSENMRVGLDLFAPLVSRFVGQNYTKITEYADFIKPMLYRKTEAPAGIGYEYALFEKHMRDVHGWSKTAMDKAFLDTQLDACRNALCEVYPGIEINYFNDIVDTNPEYIEESLASARDMGFESAVLCWNVMEAPDAHIDAAAGI